MDLAREIANGVMADVLMRSVAEHLDADWQEYLTIYGDPATSGEGRAAAYAKLLAIAPYRALVCSAVDIADREQPPSADVVQIGARE